MSKTPILATVLLSLAPACLPAAPSDPLLAGWGFGVQAGVQGVGVHIRKDIHTNLYLKLEGNYLKGSEEIELDGIDYSGDLDFSNTGLLLNYLPFGSDSGFRFTAGVFYGKNQLGIEASSAGEVIEINDIDYELQTGDFVRGDLEFDSFNPYFGIGWDWIFGEFGQISVGLDIGVIYLGDPSVKLSSSAGLGIPAADLEAERREILSEAEDFRFLPVVKLGLTYRF